MFDGFTRIAGGLPIVGNLFDPAKADLDPLKQSQERAFKTQDELAAERANFQGAYQPGAENRFRAGQERALGLISDAAMGRAPSAAELMLKRDADTNAARAFGMASALQGRSPGGALQDASNAAAQIQAQAAQQAAIQRANEQATARQQLIQGFTGARGSEQGLLGLDTDWRKALLGGEMGALGAGAKAAGDYADASAKQAAGENAMTGSLAGGASQLFLPRPRIG